MVSTSSSPKTFLRLNTYSDQWWPKDADNLSAKLTGLFWVWEYFACIFGLGLESELCSFKIDFVMALSRFCVLPQTSQATGSSLLCWQRSRWDLGKEGWISNHFYFILFLNLLLFCVCACTCALWKSEDNQRELAFLFLPHGYHGSNSGSKHQLVLPFKKAEGKSIKRLMLLKVRCVRFWVQGTVLTYFFSFGQGWRAPPRFLPSPSLSCKNRCLW